MITPFAPGSVIHFLGLEAVGKAVLDSHEYYRVNLTGSVNLLRVMEEIACNRLVFSWSETVFGDPREMPILETHDQNPTNPYGYFKCHVEQVVEDWDHATPAQAAVNLRYFSPVGAHPTSVLDEEPQGVPRNLLPGVAQVATRQRQKLLIFENDHDYNYDIIGLMRVRNYSHSVDLAAAHLKALDLTG